MKKSPRLGPVVASIVCLLPLAVIWIQAGNWVRQSSFQMWLMLEATIAISALLAMAFSLIGFRSRPWPLKVLGIATLLVAFAVGALEMFWFL